MSTTDLDASPVTVTAVTCPNCKHTVFSRARHDMRSCPCGGVSIDGGFAYTRGAWRSDLVGDWPGTKFISVNASRRELYDDWNRHLDKHGCIAPGVVLSEVDPPKESEG